MTPNEDRKYDRDLLLGPEKRNQIVELWEVEKYGRDCFNDPDHVHLYGMPPHEWYDHGVRILARTCLEAVKDPGFESPGLAAGCRRSSRAELPSQVSVMRGRTDQA